MSKDCGSSVTIKVSDLAKLCVLLEESTKLNEAINCVRNLPALADQLQQKSYAYDNRFNEICEANGIDLDELYSNQGYYLYHELDAELEKEVE